METFSIQNVFKWMQRLVFFGCVHSVSCNQRSNELPRNAVLLMGLFSDYSSNIMLKSKGIVFQVQVQFLPTSFEHDDAQSIAVMSGRIPHTQETKCNHILPFDCFLQW